MSALREWAATLGPAAKAAVAVNAWGKWKTATQVSAPCQVLHVAETQTQQQLLARSARLVPSACAHACTAECL